MTGTLVSCWVAGTPRPKGSWTPGRNGKLRPAQAQSTDWQQHVAQTVRAGWIGREPFRGDAGFSAQFLIKRPMGVDVIARPRPTGGVKRGGTYDGDKLIRLVADALSACTGRGSAGCVCAAKPRERKHAGVLADDDRIADWGPFPLRWAPEGGVPGVLITVWAL